MPPDPHIGESADHAATFSPFNTPVGRESELARFDSVLRRDASALVLITGDSEMANSALLHAFIHRAEAVDWTVVGPLTISPDIDKVRFGTALSISEEDLRPAGSLAERSAELVGQRGTEISQSAATAVDTTDPLIVALRRLQPLLIAIDGYRPSSEFDEWLLDDFVPELSSSCRVLIVFAEELKQAPRLRPRAEVFELDRLSHSEIRHRLELIGARLSPSAGEDEIKSWIGAVEEDIDLIDPLARALALARARSVSLEHG